MLASEVAGESQSGSDSPIRADASLSLTRREWSAHGILRTNILIALARRRKKRRAGWLTLERLVDWAITRRDL
jgi:hypothetical protein